MDPVSAIGLSGSIVGIVDVIARSILSLLDLQKQFKDADGTLIALIGQLQTMKAGLEQVRALIDDSEQSYQLQMDLSSAVKACDVRVHNLDEKITELDRSKADKLTFESKVRLVLGSKGTEVCLTRLDRQANAITMLISALNW